MESYKKAAAFVAYGKVTGRYHKSFPKPSKGVCIIAIPFKANASLCSNAMFPSILESPRLVRNLPRHKKETKKDVILQKTLCYILSNSSSAYKFQGIHQICCKFHVKCIQTHIYKYHCQYHVQFHVQYFLYFSK